MAVSGSELVTRSSTLSCAQAEVRVWGLEQLDLQQTLAQPAGSHVPPSGLSFGGRSFDQRRRRSRSAGRSLSNTASENMPSWCNIVEPGLLCIVKEVHLRFCLAQIVCRKFDELLFFCPVLNEEYLKFSFC